VEALLMKVDVARDTLFDVLISWLTSPQPPSLAAVRAAIWRWFHAYKEWEGADTFLSAFDQKRLVITQRPDESNVTDVIKTRYDMEAKRSVTGDKISYPGVTYAVGVDTLGERMIPGNYEGRNSAGIKKKYALGLFDLSGSLLNPQFDVIRGQLRWSITGDPKKDGQKAYWPIVFVSLPMSEDVATYNILKKFADLTKDMLIRETMRYIRHRMTRPKLAAAEDIGAGPFDIASPGDPAKFKYGWKANEGVLTEETKKRAETAANDYQKILENAKTYKRKEKVTNSNEITVALRQRQSKRFPIITKFDPKETVFRLLDPNSKEFFPELTIPDKWKDTKEARSV
jgi:hypothetical protein